METTQSTLSGLEPLLSIEELAAYLDVPVTTIRDWRTDGKGPCAMVSAKAAVYPGVTTYTARSPTRVIVGAKQRPETHGLVGGPRQIRLHRGSRMSALSLSSICAAAVTDIGSI